MVLGGSLHWIFQRSLICKIQCMSANETVRTSFYFFPLPQSVSVTGRLTFWSLNNLNIPSHFAFFLLCRTRKYRSFQTTYVSSSPLCFCLHCLLLSTGYVIRLPRHSAFHRVFLCQQFPRCWDINRSPRHRSMRVRPEWSLNKYFFSKKLGLGSI